MILTWQIVRQEWRKDIHLPMEERPYRLGVWFGEKMGEEGVSLSWGVK